MANELVKMADVLRHCSLPAGDTTNQAELQIMIDAATPIVEYITGPINPTTYASEVHNPRGDSRILLRHPPVISVSSIVEYVSSMAYPLTNQPPGATTDNYGYSLDRPTAGLLVRRGASGDEIGFFGSTVVVTYIAGLSAIPADVKLAVLEDIRGLWQQSRIGGRPNFGGGIPNEDGWAAPMHLFPRLAAILAGKSRTQSIA